MHEELLKGSGGGQVDEETLLGRRVNRLKREIEMKDAKIAEL